MAGFLDVLLRGLLLTLTSIATGGVAWLALVLRVEPGVKPDASARAALRLVGAAALLAALVQAAVGLLVLGDLAARTGGLPLGPYLATNFARVTLVRILLAAVLGGLALRLAGRPAGPWAWLALGALALGLVVSSA